MRYQARWSNGYWKTFDRNLFTDIAIHGRKVDAEEAVNALNAKPKK